MAVKHRIDEDDDRTVFDLNIKEALADDADADDAPDAEEDSDGEADEVAVDISADDDLLADLNHVIATGDESHGETASAAKPLRRASETAAKRSAKPASSRRAKPEAPTAPAEAINPEVLGALSTMALNIVAVLGKKRMTVSEVARLHTGSVLDLDGDPNNLIDLVCDGKTLGKGELVLVDGKLGVRLVTAV